MHPMHQHLLQDLSEMIRCHFQKVKLKAPSNQHIDKLLDKVRAEI